MSKRLEVIIKRVGKKYIEAPKSKRITIGKILSGKINVNI
jgi:hypothetical protein